MPPHPEIPRVLTSAPFTLEEALRAGVTREQLRGPSWRRLTRGLYSFIGVTVSEFDLLAAVRLRLPEGAAFSGVTAGWLHGLDLTPCDPIEVTVPPEAGVSARSGVRIRRSRLAATEVVERRLLPVTTPLRTLTDIGRLRPLVTGVIAADMALHAGLITLQELGSFGATARGLPGLNRLRRVVELAEPKTESPMETRLRLELVMAGLPRPEAQVALYDRQGQFMARPDFLYRDARLAIEYDGGTHRDSLVADNQRQNRLLAEGYNLLRFTAADLAAESSIVRQVKTALDRPTAGTRAYQRAGIAPVAGRR